MKIFQGALIITVTARSCFLHHFQYHRQPVSSSPVWGLVLVSISRAPFCPGHNLWVRFLRLLQHGNSIDDSGSAASAPISWQLQGGSPSTPQQNPLLLTLDPLQHHTLHFFPPSIHPAHTYTHPIIVDTSIRVSISLQLPTIFIQLHFFLSRLHCLVHFSEC